MRFFQKAIEVKNLNYKKIIQDLSFEVNAGDYVAIIGPNGGGKSTILKLLLGLLSKDSGVIKLFGTKQEHFGQLHTIGYVPQQVAQVDLNFPATVQEVVLMGLAKGGRFRPFYSKTEREACDELLVKLGIYELSGRLIGTLSGGQRQKVMIARSLISKPKMLILDEPNTGVDTSSQRVFYDFLKQLNIENNITILFVTHDLGHIADDVKQVFCVNQTIVPVQNHVVCTHQH